MAFIQFIIYFSEDDAEQKENLGLKPDRTEGKISVNTNQMCAYNEMDNGNTLIRMASGECYETPLSVDEFENLLSEVEGIFDLTNLSDN